MNGESGQPEPDAVDEALVRANLPRRFRGTVEATDVEVLATMGQEAPLVIVRALERDGPYDNVVPASEYVAQAGSAIEAAEHASQLAERYGLEVVEG